VLHVHPQRTSVRGQSPHVDEGEAVTREEPRNGRHGEIAQVLVVNRVELAMVDQVPDIRSFDNRDAAFLQQRSDAVDDTSEVGDVREHIVRVDHIRAVPFRDQLLSERAPEEILTYGDACLSRRRRGPGRGVNAEYGDTTLDVVLEQVAVVRRDLHHEARGAELTRVRKLECILPAVAKPCIGEG
jgi:hypothetical protein